MIFLYEYSLRFAGLYNWAEQRLSLRCLVLTQRSLFDQISNWVRLNLALIVRLMGSKRCYSLDRSRLLRLSYSELHLLLAIYINHLLQLLLQSFIVAGSFVQHLLELRAFARVRKVVLLRVVGLTPY